MGRATARATRQGDALLTRLISMRTVVVTAQTAIRGLIGFGIYNLATSFVAATLRASQAHQALFDIGVQAGLTEQEIADYARSNGAYAERIENDYRTLISTSDDWRVRQQETFGQAARDWEAFTGFITGAVSTVTSAFTGAVSSIGEFGALVYGAARGNTSPTSRAAIARYAQERGISFDQASDRLTFEFTLTDAEIRKLDRVFGNGSRTLETRIQDAYAVGADRLYIAMRDGTDYFAARAGFSEAFRGTRSSQTPSSQDVRARGALTATDLFYGFRSAPPRTEIPGRDLGPQSTRAFNSATLNALERSFNQALGGDNFDQAITNLFELRDFRLTQASLLETAGEQFLGGLTPEQFLAQNSAAEQGFGATVSDAAIQGAEYLLSSDYALVVADNINAAVSAALPQRKADTINIYINNEQVDQADIIAEYFRNGQIPTGPVVA